jgi:hypothetical protein
MLKEFDVHLLPPNTTFFTHYRTLICHDMLCTNTQEYVHFDFETNLLCSELLSCLQNRKIGTALLIVSPSRRTKAHINTPRCCQVSCTQHLETRGSVFRPASLCCMSLLTDMDCSLRHVNPYSSMRGQLVVCSHHMQCVQTAELAYRS